MLKFTKRIINHNIPNTSTSILSTIENLILNHNRIDVQFYKLARNLIFLTIFLMNETYKMATNIRIPASNKPNNLHSFTIEDQIKLKFTETFTP